MQTAEYNDYLAELIRTTLTKYPQAVIKALQNRPLVGPGGVRQILGGYDLEFFGKAYFPEYHKYPTPQFHKDAYVELNKVLNNQPSRARIVRAWPRSNAKSTIYNFFAPTSAALYGKRHMLVQVSDSESQAESFLADVKSAVENNERIIEDFGDTRGSVWRADLISVNSVNGNVSWIAAVGAGSSVRGLRKGENRPDCIIVDDLENDDSVLTPARIEKMWLWFQRALMNLGDEHTDVIVVGTVLADGCVLDRLLKSPTWDSRKLSAIIKWSPSPLWEDWKKIYTDLSLPKEVREAKADEFYEEHKRDMIEGTEVLWPEGKPYVELMKIYVDIGETAFHSEHQNEPINFDECLFRPEWIHYYTDDEFERVRIVSYYGALDPSLGKTRLADYTALIVLGKGDNGFLYVIDAVIERMNPDRIIQLLLQKGREYEFVRFGVEVNQWQDLLRLMVIERGAKEGLYLPIVELRHSKDKVLRVQVLIPYVKNGYIRFRREHRLLMEQLLGFPKLRHDDGPDCLEMAVRMVSQGPAMEPVLTGTAPEKDYSDDDDDAGYGQRYFYA